MSALDGDRWRFTVSNYPGEFDYGNLTNNNPVVVVVPNRSKRINIDARDEGDASFNEYWDNITTELLWIQYIPSVVKMTNSTQLRWSNLPVLQLALFANIRMQPTRQNFMLPMV